MLMLQVSQGGFDDCRGALTSGPSNVMHMLTSWKLRTPAEQGRHYNSYTGGPAAMLALLYMC